MNEAQFVNAVLHNRVNQAVLERMPVLGLSDVWLVSGALFQSVWNALSGRMPDFGIKDYDIFYFDPDTSWEAEDRAIRYAAEQLTDLTVAIEIRNQARVHLWFEKKFGAPYTPLNKSTDGIDRFLMTCAQFGISRTLPASNTGFQPVPGYRVYAPSGFDDLTQMVVRPNRRENFQAANYYEKARRWRKLWPQLTILPADSG